jgi:hypothetical protein
MAERIAPNLRAPGVKLGLAQEIIAANPAQCNESVSATSTIAALPSRRNIIGSSHRGQICVVRTFVGKLYDDPNESRSHAFGSRHSLLLPTSTKISIDADQT